MLMDPSTMLPYIWVNIVDKMQNVFGLETRMESENNKEQAIVWAVNTRKPLHIRTSNKLSFKKSLRVRTSNELSFRKPLL